MSLKIVYPKRVYRSNYPLFMSLEARMMRANTIQIREQYNAPLGGSIVVASLPFAIPSSSYYLLILSHLAACISYTATGNI